MAFVIDRVFSDYHQFMEDHRDRRSLNLPLLESSWPVVTIIAVYLYVVLKAGPEYMKHREAYYLKGVIRVYNIVQVIANGALFLRTLYVIFRSKSFSFTCQPVNYTKTRDGYDELYLAYGYFLLKVVDLADTVFFVLRKKQSHVTFLHVYHHSMVGLAAYLAAIFVPGGHFIILSAWNTLVHTVMYFYYYLASYGNQNGWKRYMTKLQLLQFIHLGFHFGRPALSGSDCGFPRFWHWVGFSQSIFLFVMFMDFYVKSYTKGSTKKKT